AWQDRRGNADRLSDGQRSRHRGGLKNCPSECLARTREEHEMTDTPTVRPEHLSVALLSVANTLDAMIKTHRMDRAAIAGFIGQTRDSLYPQLREGMLGQLLDYWINVVVEQPSRVPPPRFT